MPEDQLHGVQERHPFPPSPRTTRPSRRPFATETAKVGLGMGRRGLIKASVASVGAVAALPAVVPLLSLGETKGKEKALGNTPFQRPRPRASAWS